MFHHYSENSSSTGEPPTPPSTAPSNLLPAPGVEGSIQRLPMGSSRSLNAQEPDSGYEASPSSIADNNSCTLHFFGEQSMEAGATAAESSSLDVRLMEEEDDDAHDSVFLILDSDIDEWDMCPDCNSYALCDCYRNDSSNTASDATATTLAGCDDNSSRSSDLSSSNRPSSSPVRIPSRTTVSRTLPWTGTSPLVDLRLTSRSADCPRRGATPSLQAFGLISGSHPLSWPPAAAPWLNQGGPFSTALPVYLSPNLNSAAWVRTRTNRRPVRSRRRLIDSDASSLSSSEEDGPEEVFSMAAESAPPFELPLPDLVLESTSTNEGRRSRSLSVNLPLDQGDINLDRIQAIGRTLRRLSDQFEQRRQVRSRTARRMTIGDIVHFRRAP